MATLSLYKCYECKVRDIDPNILEEGKDYIKHGTHYYHKSCYDLRERRKQNPNINDEASDDFWKDATYDYLKKVIKLDVSTLFFKQWHTFLNQKGSDYTAKGLYFAILYFYEIKKGNKDKSHGGIGIIPYIYDESRKYWYNRENRQHGIVEQIEKQIREAVQREQVIVMKKETKKDKYKIDFSVLDNLEEDE